MSMSKAKRIKVIVVMLIEMFGFRSPRFFIQREGQSLSFQNQPQ